MSGSSLDGLDIAYVEFHENNGVWNYEFLHADCYEYPDEWKQKLQNATGLNALDYQLLHAEYGHYLGERVNHFIDQNALHYKVSLIASHGHTTFHVPGKSMTSQIGDGAAIAASTALPVVNDLRAMDIAFGGQGAPIVPIGEKLLLNDHSMFLNLGGIANISFNVSDKYIAFDVCPANRVLNLLSGMVDKDFDAGGQMAAMGNVILELLEKLDNLEYYRKPYPKSLANSFGVDVVFPLIKSYAIPHTDGLRTYTEHIVRQISKSITEVNPNGENRLLVTGGGAFNNFLVSRLSDELKKLNVETVIPGEDLVKYKEAMIMAFIGVLRWRQEYNVLASVTGAGRNSIGGALWNGQEA